MAELEALGMTSLTRGELHCPADSSGIWSRPKACDYQQRTWLLVVQNLPSSSSPGPSSLAGGSTQLSETVSI
jgi:hypothetical protein